MSTTIAVIVPTYNEEMNIGPTLDCAQKHLQGLAAQYVVADNGSTDSTVDVALQSGAEVIVHDKKSIGALRNLGVSKSNADLLVFIDADVHLTRSWAKRFPDVAAKILRNPRRLSGSNCGIPKNPTWIERYWFLPVSRRSKGYINSGHLIISRPFFEELGGFDESLETGEDYDICQRAVALGGSLRPDPELVVEHVGFPRSLTAFVARESWHGLGDYRSISTIVRSKVALAALLFGLLHTLGIVLLLSGQLGLAIATAVAIAVLAVTASHRLASPVGIGESFAAAGIAYFYLVGRLLAAFWAIHRRPRTHHERRIT